MCTWLITGVFQSASLFYTLLAVGITWLHILLDFLYFDQLALHYRLSYTAADVEGDVLESVLKVIIRNNISAILYLLQHETRHINLTKFLIGYRTVIGCNLVLSKNLSLPWSIKFIFTFYHYIGWNRISVEIIHKVSVQKLIDEILFQVLRNVENIAYFENRRIVMNKIKISSLFSEGFNGRRCLKRNRFWTWILSQLLVESTGRCLFLFRNTFI